MERRKNAAPYHVRRSAVKKVQVAKRGIEITRQISPAEADHLGFCLKAKNKNAITKTIS